MQNDKTLLADFGSKTSFLGSDKTGCLVSAEAGSPATQTEILAQVNSQNPLHKNVQICNTSVSDKMEIAKQIKHSRVDIISQSKSSCIFLNTYYNKFLEDHYGADPQLMSAPYVQQLRSLQESFLGDSDFYSKWVVEAGLNAEDLIINCQPLQQSWARENNFYGQGLNIAVEQIRRKKPQAVYIQDLNFAGADFLAAIRPHTKLIVGQIASPVPPQADLSSFDIIFSSFPHFVERFRKMGITSYYQPLAFDQRVLERIGTSPKTYPVTFIGGMSPIHCKGQQILEDLSRLVPMDFWGYGAENLPPESIIRKRHHGQIWGMEMFSALQKSFITINRHIDVAENNANNMRLFEATGCGTMLITDYKDNLNELFEIGKEVVAYRSPEEAAALVKYYLQNPKEAEEIALAGQRRTLRDHTYEKRMSQTAEILERHLRYKREKNRFPAPDMSKIASVPKSIDSSEVTSELTSAWQDKDIPARQRALTQQELNAMYKGSQPQIYNILADILRPCVTPDSTILEIGCATGYYYEILEYLLNKRISYTGVDYSEALISMAKDFYPKTEFIAADGANLPFEDGQFSIAISSCMLLHVPNYPQHIAETARVADRFVVAHRTPVCRQRPTQYYKKLAYGVETVELRFNENEIISEFASYGLKLINAVEYYTKPNADEFEVTYLFKKSELVSRKTNSSFACKGIPSAHSETPSCFTKCEELPERTNSVSESKYNNNAITNELLSNPQKIMERMARILDSNQMNISDPIFHELIANPQMVGLTHEDLEGKSEPQKAKLVAGEYFAKIASCSGKIASELLFSGQWDYEQPDWFDHRHHLLYPEKHFNDFWTMSADNALRVLPLHGKLLNLCSGDGFYDYHFYRKRAKEIVCVDVNHQHAPRLYQAENIDYIQHDVLAYQPQGSYYDVVLIRGAIEHFSQSDQQLIFQKAFNALKPGGWFCGDTPANAESDKTLLDAHENEWENETEMRQELGKVFSHIETYTIESTERTTLFWQCRKP